MAEYQTVPAGKVSTLMSKTDRKPRVPYLVCYSLDLGVTYFVYGAYRSQRAAEKIVQGFRDLGNFFAFTCFFNPNDLLTYYIDLGFAPN